MTCIINASSYTISLLKQEKLVLGHGSEGRSISTNAGYIIGYGCHLKTRIHCQCRINQGQAILASPQKCLRSHCIRNTKFHDGNKSKRSPWNKILRLVLGLKFNDHPRWLRAKWLKRTIFKTEFRDKTEWRLTLNTGQTTSHCRSVLLNAVVI